MQLKWPMRWDLFSLFPAYAGVILDQLHKGLVSMTFPRTRGGDPARPAAFAVGEFFSPHTRG